MTAAGRTDAHAHLAARPEVCEIEAIGRAVAFAEWTGARLHIAHHSAADSLYILRDAKHMANAAEIAFELLLERVMHTRWEHVLTPQMRPVQQKWRAPKP